VRLELQSRVPPTHLTIECVRGLYLAMETLERTYNLDEAAEALCISRWTLRDWVSRHEVPHRRRGRVKGIYFTESDLAEILDAQARPALALPTQARKSRQAPLVSVEDLPAEFAVLRRGTGS